MLFSLFFFSQLLFCCCRSYCEE